MDAWNRGVLGALGRPGTAAARLAAWLVPGLMVSACTNLGVEDAQSLLAPGFTRSEVFGFVAGIGTTFAAVPDLLAMLRRRSSAGMHPRMAAITAIFQALWVYYGLLIQSRPVIAWNLLAVMINSFTVAAYFYFRRRDDDARSARDGKAGSSPVPFTS